MSIKMFLSCYNWDFKDFEEKKAMLCTECKTELVGGCKFCHECGQPINKKQGKDNDILMEESSFITDQSTDAVTGSKMVSPMLEKNVETDKHAEVAADKNAQVATGKTPKIYDIDEITKMFHLNERREEFRALCEKYTEKWKEKPVKFGITGASSTGKSSFINAITGLKEHENGFAETSPYGDTTKVAKCYSHPKNPKFELWDLPGVGTVNYKLRNYVKDMSLEEYDYFLIFFNVIVEQDIELAMKLKRLDKPLCFVRSKLDLETQNEMQDENTTIDTFYKKALTDLEKEGMGYVDVFVISSKNTALGNFESLMNHMQDNLSVGQYAAVIHSLSLMSEPVIRQKYEIITRRLGIIYIASMYFIKHDLRYTTYTKQIRSDIILTNLTEEVMGYIDTFELTKQTIERLHVMEHSAFKMKVILNKTDEQIKTFIKDKLQLQNVKMIEEDCSFTFLPGQIESFLFHSEKLLKDILVNLKEDALQVLKRLVTNPVV